MTAEVTGTVDTEIGVRPTDDDYNEARTSTAPLCIQRYTSGWVAHSAGRGLRHGLQGPVRAVPARHRVQLGIP